MQFFTGLLKGICADGTIVRSEIRRVESWIAVNKDVANMFPVKPVHERLCKVLADDKNSDEELSDLSDLLSEIAGDKFKETGDVDGSIGEVFCDDVRRFSFQGKFVLPVSFSLALESNAWPTPKYWVHL